MKIKYTSFIFLAMLFMIAAFQNCSQSYKPENLVATNLRPSSSLALLQSNIQLQRISNLEYVNSITDALNYQFSRQSFSTASVAGIQSSLVSSYAALPSDLSSIRLGSSQLATSQISKDRFTSYTNIAHSVATALTSDVPTLQGFIGSCATTNTTMNTTCVNQFISNFAGLVFRTPPNSTEITELKTGISTWTELIGRILLHPRFLLHYDRDGVRSADGSYQLTAYELEAKLASVLWKSIPDLTGFQAAANGSVLTPTGLSSEVNRMLNSQKAKDTLWKFYQEWLGTGRIPMSFDTGAEFTAFVGNNITLNELNAPGFRNAVLQDGRDFLEYITWVNNGTLEDIFRSPAILTTNSTLAKIYGVTALANSSQPPIMDTSGHYSGILTRALITQQKPGAGGVANHVQRGVLFLSNLLGIQLGLPASFAEQNKLADQVLSTDSSMKEIKIKTSLATCLSCHQTINPSGYALAKYDSLGRFNDIEIRYGQNSSGAAVVVANNSIDPTSNIQIDGKSYLITNPSTFVDALVQSGKLFDGFSIYYFRFSLGRIEDSISDGSLLEQFRTNLKSNSLKNAIIAFVQNPSFAKVKPTK